MARYSLDFWLTSEDLSDPDNRVTLDGHDGIVLSYRPNNEEAHQRLTAKLEGAMQAQTKCAMHGHESSGAVNPALTVMANALRVGDHLTARLR